jgi:hypothetical protein
MVSCDAKGSKVMVTVSAIKCPGCGTILFSRARHDFHYCPCGDVSIDGGLDYMKVSFKATPPDHITIDLDVTAQDLHNDWKHGYDNYGIIKTT